MQKNIKLIVLDVAGNRSEFYMKGDPKFDGSVEQLADLMKSLDNVETLTFPDASGPRVVRVRLGQYATWALEAVEAA